MNSTEWIFIGIGMALAVCAAGFGFYFYFKKQELPEISERLVTANKFSRTIAQLLDLEQIFIYAANFIRDNFNLLSVNIFIVRPGTKDLIPKGSARDKTVEALKKEQSLDKDDEIIRQAFLNSHSIVERSPVQQNINYFHESRFSRLAFPIMLDEETIGVLGVIRGKKGCLDKRDYLIIRFLTDQLAAALKNEQLYTESRQVAILEERNRIATEIHDSLSQDLAGIIIQLNASEEFMEDNLAAAKIHLNRARELARESLNEVKYRIWTLRPQDQNHISLKEKLNREIDILAKYRYIQANLKTTGEERALKGEIEDALIRISQESLTNIKKYSRASMVDINIDYAEHSVELMIKDNGVGFNLNALKAGSFGLMQMKERAQSLGGSFVVESAEGIGTFIKVSIPTD